MNQQHFLGLASALWLGAGSLPAQELKQVEQLQQQLKQLQEQFDRVQQDQRRQLDALQRQLDALQKPSGEPADAKAVGTEPPVASRAPVASGWSPTNQMRLGAGRSYVDLSMAAMVAGGGSTAEDVDALQAGGHDPHERGFNVQSIDLTLSGAVDPYFRGRSTIVYLRNPDGETGVEIEEGYLESTALPANLQLKAGYYFTEFGRVNGQHPDAWAFVDQPLVNARFLGPDGLRNPGARVSWLVPTPFYSELYFGVQNSGGGTAHSFRNDHGGDPLFGRPVGLPRVKSFGDLLYAPRYAMSFDLTENQTMVAGVSAAVGPNGSGTGNDSQVFGLDLFWKWKPARQEGGYPFVSWQTEAMVRRYDAEAYAEDTDGDGVLDLDLPRERLLDYGFYSQVSWGFRKGWIAGMRGEWVDGERGAFAPDPDRDGRWRISPSLTWHPTEFSRFRLQYNRDRREGVGTDHSVWVQWLFLLGAHPPHNY